MGNTLSGVKDSLQIAKMGNIPAGEFSLGMPFLVKNITEDAITITIKPAGQSNTISTLLYPGWNPELIASIIGAPVNSLQYGY